MADFCVDNTQQVEFDEKVVCGLWQCEALRASQKADGSGRHVKYMDFIEIADADAGAAQKNTFHEMPRDFKKRTRWRTRMRISVNAP